MLLRERRLALPRLPTEHGERGVRRDGGRELSPSAWPGARRVCAGRGLGPAARLLVARREEVAEPVHLGGRPHERLVHVRAVCLALLREEGLGGLERGRAGARGGERLAVGLEELRDKV